jgi:hypothetical protein
MAIATTIAFVEEIMWKRFSSVVVQAGSPPAGARLAVALLRSRVAAFALLADRALAG